MESVPEISNAPAHLPRSAADGARFRRKSFMANPLPYFPFYIDDWDTSEDVRLMSAEDRGVYLGALIVQWRYGTVPDDPAKFARLALLDQTEVARAWPRVRALFESTETGLRNARLQAERDKIAALKDKRSDAGRLGGSVSQTKHVKQNGSKAQARASDSVSVSESPSVVEDGAEGDPKKPSAAEREKWFDEEFWPVVWQKIAYGAAKVAWLKKVLTRERADMLIAACKQQRELILQHAREHQHGVLHPSTWINQERWMDQPSLLPELATNGHSPPRFETVHERNKRIMDEEFTKRMSRHVRPQ